MNPRVFLLLFAAIAAPVQAADIYRCQPRAGTVTYQQFPCDQDALGGRALIPSEFPPVNVAERERLFAREAAMDKRLEAQRDRLLQEATLRMQMAERTQPVPTVVAQPAFVYFVPRAAPRWYSPHAPQRGVVLR